MKRYIYFLAAVLLFGEAFLLGQLTPPRLPASLSGHVFPQQPVFDCPDPFRPSVPDKTLTVGNLRVAVHAANAKGRPPAQIRISAEKAGELAIPLRFAGCKIWTADLDKNGKQDLVIANLDPVNGPGVQAVLVLTDDQDRLVAWQSPDAYFEFGDRGLENLVDLDGDERAELLLPEVHGIGGKPARPGEAAIETISLYTISTNGLKRIDGVFAGNIFPMVIPADAKMPMLEDRSTYVDRAASGVTIKSIMPKCPTLAIRIEDSKEAECRIVLSDDAVLVGRPDMVVIDGSTGRRIELESGARKEQMLEESRVNGYQIRYTCKSKNTVCRPLLLWAMEKKNSK
jgi:hypothetical protein